MNYDCNSSCEWKATTQLQVTLQQLSTDVHHGGNRTQGKNWNKWNKIQEQRQLNYGTLEMVVLSRWMEGTKMWVWQKKMDQGFNSSTAETISSSRLNYNTVPVSFNFSGKVLKFKGSPKGVVLRTTLCCIPKTKEQINIQVQYVSTQPETRQLHIKTIEWWSVTWGEIACSQNSIFSLPLKPANTEDRKSSGRERKKAWLRGRGGGEPTSFPGSFISRPPPPSGAGAVRWKSLGTRLAGSEKNRGSVHIF